MDNMIIVALMVLATVFANPFLSAADAKVAPKQVAKVAVAQADDEDEEETDDDEPSEQDDEENEDE